MTNSFKSIFGSAAVIAGLLFTSSASALGITGNVNFTGDLKVDTGNLATANAFTSFSGVKVAPPVDGPYTGTTGTSVTMTPFAFDPFVGPITPVWTFTSGGDVFSFKLTSVDSVQQGGTGLGAFLTVIGSGIASITGYDDTEGTFSISTQGRPVKSKFSFSAFAGATSVPENGSALALMGLALLGVEAARRTLKSVKA